MGRPPLEPGTWGTVRFYVQRNGRVLARSRYRDASGVVHLKRATADTAEAAERKMKQTVIVSARGDHSLSLASKVPDLAKWWIAGLQAAGHQGERTIENYEYDSRAVAAAFSEIRLAELTVGVVDAVILALSRADAARARRVHDTLGRMCDEAVRVGVLELNPVDRVRAPRRVARRPYALTAGQATFLRHHLHHWLETRSKPGPLPDLRVATMVDVMLATGLRVGELLALRQCDVALSADPPTLLVAATLTEEKSGRPHWQEHPKDERQRRRLVLPQFAVAALGPLMTDPSSGAPVFPNRHGSWIRPGNLRRVLRNFAEDAHDVLKGAGIDPKEVHPHLFRRTVGTLIAAELGVDRAKEQLGHASIRTTERHYIAPPPVAGAESAVLLNRLFADRSAREANAIDDPPEADH
ncbi:tyrosine-type recombinase/integrase [Agrococcus sp. HG114]|uniref:tyrosine-type recombinase/integrase n=1 Tax=Agrococcus sp. HG114 TaxID=2969757 RepID=UPI00215B1AB0|nr:tyrosine-type recombinase/integrase [Agrococcus sp. HG114]MCR8670111.1 tyrosine-type recombinase/integrase [Agrococcus sp. HG114]